MSYNYMDWRKYFHIIQSLTRKDTSEFENVKRKGVIKLISTLGEKGKCQMSTWSQGLLIEKVIVQFETYKQGML
jgi:hypothetical protein